MVSNLVDGLSTTASGSSSALDVYPENRDIERALCEVLSEVAGVTNVSPDSHFFEDLNADSMTMAKFCARVRKRPDLPSVSMKDIYRNPTVRGLAAALVKASPVTSEPSVPVLAEMPTPGSTRQYVLCGVLQLLAFLAYIYGAAMAATTAYSWISAGSGFVQIYLRCVLAGGALFLVMCTLPIAAKWILIGRWKPERIPVWSMRYFRFWLVKTLVRANPLVLMVGSPLHILYLRALGAKIGKDVAIFAVETPVCTDLLTIGDGTVIRKDSHISGYHAIAGVIETGSVTIGKNALVSEQTVVDIGTSMGDGAQLGHASSLHTGQSVPDGEHWHGSPAQPTQTDFQTVQPMPLGTVRKVSYSAMQLVTTLFLYVPLTNAVLVVLFGEFPRLAAWMPGENAVVDVVVASLVFLVGLTVLGLLGAFVVPRILHLAFQPGKAYPFYGIHYSLHRTILRLTNLHFYLELFGNSSYILHYLKVLGYKISMEEQTGSNFGSAVKQENPYLVTVGRGTMVADGLSVLNADYSSSSFRLAHTTIGAHNFLGNTIAYPSQGKTGENCLLATKVMVPIDGHVRENVGLLGSPSFEIPRSVERDSRFDHLRTPDQLKASVAVKNRHNIRTMGLFLLSRWVHFLGLSTLLFVTDFYTKFGASAAAAEIVLIMLFSLSYFMLLERAAGGFRPMSPQFCSIYDPYFWWHERFWKFALAARLATIVGGTPYKNIISRLMGAKIGKRVFDDDCGMPERTLVTVGDDCTLNKASGIQAHSQEDGAFKSDRIKIGNGCTVGIGALVHYGVTMGDGAVVAPDAFVMKGTEVAPRTVWVGNPARELQGRPSNETRPLGAAAPTAAPALAARS